MYSSIATSHNLGDVPEPEADDSTDIGECTSDVMKCCDLQLDR